MIIASSLPMVFGWAVLLDLFVAVVARSAFTAWTCFRTPEEERKRGPEMAGPIPGEPSHEADGQSPSLKAQGYFRQCPKP